MGRYDIWPKDNGQTHSNVATVQRDEDARLIAAAPELLEACKAAIAQFIEDGNPDSLEQADKNRVVSWELIEKAIAKATGGAE